MNFSSFLIQMALASLAVSVVFSLLFPPLARRLGLVDKPGGAQNPYRQYSFIGRRGYFHHFLRGLGLSIDAQRRFDICNGTVVRSRSL